jgi:hypothetical protein
MTWISAATPRRTLRPTSNVGAQRAQARRAVQRGKSGMAAQPFTAPCMIPDTNCRPAKKNSTISGTLAATTPAMISE